MSKKSKAQLEEENRVLKRSRMVDRTAIAIHSTLKVAGICFLGWCAVLLGRSTEHVLIAYAGKATFAHVFIQILGKLNVGIGVATGAGGIIYGRHQKKLKEDLAKRLGERIKRLEAQIDPRRSSSMLRETGDTRQEDRYP